MAIFVGVATKFTIIELVAKFGSLVSHQSKMVVLNSIVGWMDGDNIGRSW